MVDNMTLTGRFSMLNAEADLTYDLGDIYDMGGDTHDRYPELCNLWSVTLCWQGSREPQLYTSRVGTDLPSALQR